MLGASLRIYRASRKKNDQLFNVYVMRPLASPIVAMLEPTAVSPNQVTLLNLVVFWGAALAFVALPSWHGGLVAIGLLEASYCLDCADGMLARVRGQASKAGHLLDFFIDEVKAVLLVAALGVRLWRTGGYGMDATHWAAGDPRFLLAGVAGVAAVACALSLTNFVRRPEVSGRETTVEAFYESAGRPSGVGAWLGTFVRFLNHYPSHVWIWALAGRLDAYLWLYVGLNAAYLGKGWLGLFLRFGRR